MTESTRAWWQNRVVYQVYPRSFQDTTGNGIGDVNGIRKRLDHLADLGVDIIWLSPIYASPQVDNGYDISDYEAIDPLFGTMEDVEALIAEGREQGIRIVMDLVVNHTSDQHAWFTESRSSRDNARADWYIWRDAKAVDGLKPGEPGTEPNNWESFFSGPAWRWDDTREQFYLHLFAVEQPDLNWENADVRHAVYDMMRRWLDRGIGGFRMDVINLLSKRDGLPDAGPTGGGPWPKGGENYFNGPRIHEFLQDMHREVFEGRDAELITVGETPGVTVADAREYSDAKRHEVDMVFTFEHVSLDVGDDKFDWRGFDLVPFKQNLASYQFGLADAGWNSLYLANHDQPRPVSRFGNDRDYRFESATLLGTMLHMHRGTPYIYQGEEIGMTNTQFNSLDDFADIESINYANERLAAGDSADDFLPGMRVLSRDNARTPVQWDGSETAGFTTGTPWLPVNPAAKTINVEADRAAERSVFEHYRALIALRHDDETVALGDFDLLEPDHETLWAITRTRGDDRIIALGNVSDAPLEITDEVRRYVGDASATLLLGNYGDTGVLEPLQPWEARVYRLA